MESRQCIFTASETEVVKDIRIVKRGKRNMLFLRGKELLFSPLCGRM